MVRVAPADSAQTVLTRGISSGKLACGFLPLLVQLGLDQRDYIAAPDFKSRDWAITESYETIQVSIYAPSGRQGMVSAGFVSTRPATILAPSFICVFSSVSRVLHHTQPRADVPPHSIEGDRVRRLQVPERRPALAARLTARQA